MSEEELSRISSEKVELLKKRYGEINDVRVDCWCYCIKKQVWVKGEIAGKRQAELLRVTDCEEKTCPMRYSKFCLIGKLREGRWR